MLCALPQRSWRLISVECDRLAKGRARLVQDRLATARKEEKGLTMNLAKEVGKYMGAFVYPIRCIQQSYKDHKT